jgi:hypothetical protein
MFAGTRPCTPQHFCKWFWYERTVRRPLGEPVGNGWNGSRAFAQFPSVAAGRLINRKQLALSAFEVPDLPYL